MSFMLKTILLWALVYFAYFWAAIMCIAGQPFDALVVIALATIITFNHDEIIDK